MRAYVALHLSLYLYLVVSWRRRISACVACVIDLTRARSFVVATGSGSALACVPTVRKRCYGQMRAAHPKCSFRFDQFGKISSARHRMRACCRCAPETGLSTQHTHRLRVFTQTRNP